MSKTEENKIIINDKEYVGDEITPAVLMGAIQTLKLQLEADMDKRFKKLATNLNKESGHINLIDEAVQEHETAIQGFNKNFEMLQQMMKPPQGEDNEKD